MRGPGPGSVSPCRAREKGRISGTQQPYLFPSHVQLPPVSDHQYDGPHQSHTHTHTQSSRQERYPWIGIRDQYDLESHHGTGALSDVSDRSAAATVTSGVSSSRVAPQLMVGIPKLRLYGAY